MERESFEDDDVAHALNDSFVSIKVDREERPDIDSIYMAVCQGMTGSGGWPLTIIMTPDRKPFFAGTYFPKMGKYSRPGLLDILSSVKSAWNEKHDELVKSSEEIIKIVEKSMESHNETSLGRDTIDRAFEEFDSFFDGFYGGFGSAPKFPTPHNLSFLMRYWRLYQNKRALEIVEKTLESMYKGGIFDHIGFGFSRYSTDRKWLVPHFEKMLYDNALLAIAYTECYMVTGKNLYREVSEKVFDYVLKTIVSPEGGFYSAEDADSEGEEGKFYVWTPDEIESVVGKEDSKIFCAYYDITAKGNFEGKSIPNLINTDLNEIEGNDELKGRLNIIRQKLYEYRECRVHPYKDDKVLTSWNGLMIGALAYGGRAFDNETYIDAARSAAGFIFENLVTKDGRLLARYRDNESAYPGYLDDYAFLIYGLIELYEATFEIYYLKRAVDLNRDMLRLFWDDDRGGLFIYGIDSEELIARPKEVYDGALPSGNSVAALNMLRLSRITGDMELEEKSNTIFHTFGGIVEENPNSYSFLLMALLFSIVPSKEIVISGRTDDSDVQAMLDEVNGRFMPFSTVVLNNGDQGLFEIAPFIKNQVMIGGKTTAYVCQNFTCDKPVNDIDKFRDMLD